MSTDPNLQFIREKIYQIRSAIMYSLSNEVIKLPNNIVKAVKVDNEGQLWFVCRRPGRQVDQYEQTFPTRLHFYRKGVFCHVEVSGKATIVNDTTDFIITGSGAEKPLLIKMTMHRIY
jgi:general stress protein 26